MSKEKHYQELVQRRKQCYLCRELGMQNQSHFPKYDTEEIGNLTTWSNNLYAKVLIVEQDFYDQNSFQEQRGQVQFGKKLTGNDIVNDYSTKTNYYLKTFIDELPKEYRVTPPRNDNQSSDNPLFMTNAVLCLKQGKPDSPVKSKCISNCSNAFLEPTLELLKPDLKVIITIGRPAALSVLKIFEKQDPSFKKLRGSSLKQLLSKEYFKISGLNLVLFTLYHPARFSNRAKSDHLEDWRRVRDYLLKH